jgi:hypothetical protein
MSRPSPAKTHQEADYYMARLDFEALAGMLARARPNIVS